MNFSDIQKLNDAYLSLFVEDVGLGGHAIGTNSSNIVMGLSMPDNKPVHTDQNQNKIKATIEELKSIFSELKNAQGLEPWVASKLATAGNRVDFIHNYLVGTAR